MCVCMCMCVCVCMCKVRLYAYVFFDISGQFWTSGTSLLDFVLCIWQLFLICSHDSISARVALLELCKRRLENDQQLAKMMKDEFKIKQT